jgi:predicted O-methyltransferase YrrM
MLSKPVNNFVDKLLVTFFNKAPKRLIARMLWVLYKNPTLMDSWSYHLRPFHYYDPLPEFSAITPEQASRRRSSTCIEWNLEAQIELIKQLSTYSTELQKLDEQDSCSVKFNFFNDFFFELDAAIYYALLREFKPSKIIEIGCGYSTQMAAIALTRNQQEGQLTKLVCIEPYPEPQLAAVDFEFQHINARVETIDLNVFEQLETGDILFIDSTHTVKFGSDVCREILEILPVIKSGVWIHFHDIFFPYDYPQKWLIEERRAWNEQYMLEAFLAYNPQFEVALANHWLSVDYPQEVAKLWPGVLQWKDPYHHCGSLWLRKK